MNLRRSDDMCFATVLSYIALVVDLTVHIAVAWHLDLENEHDHILSTHHTLLLLLIAGYYLNGK
jgi:ABC-type iron transport system FetAB permease component